MHLKLKNYLLMIAAAMIFMTSETISAQLDSLKQDSITNASNIIKYRDFIATRFSVNNNFNSFFVVDNNSGTNVELTPNQRLRSVFTVQFRFVDIDIGFTPKFLTFNNDNELYGKTKFSGLGFRFYLGRWMQNIQWTTTKGFYIDYENLNTSQQDILLFPQLKVFKISGRTSYVFNPNYSFKALVKQNEWQKRSSGSFVPMASYSYTKMTDETPETDEIFNLAIGPSYHYNLIIAKKFLLSAGLFVGAGYNYVKFEFEDDRENYDVSGLLLHLESKLALGYNSTRFFIGGNLNLSTMTYDIAPETSLVDADQILEFYVGYRFNAPKALIKFTEDVQSKLGL